MPTVGDAPSCYDVAIIGGGLSGASVAVMLKNEQPSLRILVIEKSEVFDRRVGEATVEVSTWFLRRCLGLSEHLHHFHLVKNGLRFWYANERTETIADCSEIGGRYLSRVPAYLVDRAVLDEEVLHRAVKLGIELWRPATVQRVNLQHGGQSALLVRRGEMTTPISARWIVDASGFAATLARQQGWWQQNAGHPTTAAWARWRGVKDFDSLDLMRRFPDWAKASCGVRGAATNHLMGDGWWAWWIPLRGGDVSIGVVFDERLVSWPTDGGLADRLKRFLLQHPVAKELMTDAQPIVGDVHWRRRLPYRSTTIAGDGFAIVGDAAGFIDPFYSPGLDWISFTAYSATQLILKERRGAVVRGEIDAMNADFTRSYERWFDAIYREKYNYIGEFDLMQPAFLMDIGLYYLGVASQPFRRGVEALREPYFAEAPSTPFYHWMRTYNRRLASMGADRRRRGVLGQANDGRRLLIGGFYFGTGTAVIILRGLMGWMTLELKEGWRTWFRRNRPTPHERQQTLNEPKEDYLPCREVKDAEESRG